MRIVENEVALQDVKSPNVELNVIRQCFAKQGRRIISRLIFHELVQFGAWNEVANTYKVIFKHSTHKFHYGSINGIKFDNWEEFCDACEIINTRCNKAGWSGPVPF